MHCPFELSSVYSNIISCDKHVVRHTVYGKTSARENFRGYKKKPLSLEKFRGFCAEEKVWPRETMCIATAKTFTGKLSRKAENPRKPRKFSHADVLPYTVYSY